MPTPTFIATHTNSDKNLLGWNSRFIYIHSSDGVEVGSAIDTVEVFKEIDIFNKKGSVNFPQNYFVCDDGFSLKLTMFCNVNLNGTTLLFELGLRDEQGTEIVLPTKNGLYHTLPNRNEEKLFKYEAILTKYKLEDEQSLLMINGCVIYSGATNSDSSDGTVNFIQQYGKIQFYPTQKTDLILNVKGTATINVTNITIEEIK